MLKFSFSRKLFSNLVMSAQKSPGEGSLRRGASSFVPSVNIITGKQEWIFEDEQHDYFQDIARSSYADMLHDSERNKKYLEALKKAVTELKMCNKTVHVLDIGTGTGLLAMMAVTCGADKVTACEAFEPMADIAKETIKNNNMEGLIKLVQKRSTDLTVGPDGDMATKANILVTEVFDTELIGEGAISTFTHAHKYLLENDCIVVPARAHMYVQVVTSDFLKRWNQFYPVELPNGKTIQVPPEISKCRGAGCVHDLQLAQVKQEWFTPLSKPLRVFTFDWSGHNPLPFKNSRTVFSDATDSGPADACLMWWDLEMDVPGHIVLSCSPLWMQRDNPIISWRDHWMQGVYYPEICHMLKKGQEFTVEANHDEYSLWFNISIPEYPPVEPPKHEETPMDTSECGVQCCTCGAHVTASRTRLAMINNVERNNVYYEAMKKFIDESSVCVCVSDTSLLPLMAAHLGAKKVFSIERHSNSRKLLQRFINHNHLQDQIHIIEKNPEDISPADFHNLQPNVYLSEPYFTASVLPWHDSHAWFTFNTLLPLLAPSFSTIPRTMSIKAVAVEFSDLWKIRTPVSACEGFNMTYFDNCIETACCLADNDVEPHPLWEYPCRAMTDQFTLMTFDLTKKIKGVKSISRQGIEEFWCSGLCNAIVMWAEYELADSMVVSSGPILPAGQGDFISWPPHYKQAVHFLRTCAHVMRVTRKWHVKYNMTFKPAAGKFDVSFRIVQR